MYCESHFRWSMSTSKNWTHNLVRIPSFRKRVRIFTICNPDQFVTQWWIPTIRISTIRWLIFAQRLIILRTGHKLVWLFREWKWSLNNWLLNLRIYTLAQWHTLSSCRSQKFKKKKTSLTDGCEGGRETDLIKFRRPKRQFALTVVYS